MRRTCHRTVRFSLHSHTHTARHKHSCDTAIRCAGPPHAVPFVVSIPVTSQSMFVQAKRKRAAVTNPTRASKSSRKSTRSGDRHSEEDNNHSGSDTDGWSITGIRSERILWDRKSYQRQYSVHRKTQSRTVLKGTKQYTDADAHDDTDMPATALDQWRAKHPIADVLWAYGGKGGEKSARKHNNFLRKYQATFMETFS
jgi:hypothetical protein